MEGILVNDKSWNVHFCFLFFVWFQKSNLIDHSRILDKYWLVFFLSCEFYIKVVKGDLIFVGLRLLISTSFERSYWCSLQIEIDLLFRFFLSRKNAIIPFVSQIFHLSHVYTSWKFRFSMTTLFTAHNLSFQKRCCNFCRTPSNIVVFVSKSLSIVDIC